MENVVRNGEIVTISLLKALPDTPHLIREASWPLKRWLLCFPADTRYLHNTII